MHCNNTKKIDIMIIIIILKKLKNFKYGQKEIILNENEVIFNNFK